LQQGDLIVSINGLEIADESVLPNAIQTSGGLLNLGVIRDGAEEPVLVQVALRRIQKLSY
jgi:type II secretory pathway component PulC